MKCIKPSRKNLEQGGNPLEVLRVKDDAAVKAVKSGLYVYCPKREWKDRKATRTL